MDIYVFDPESLLERKERENSFQRQKELTLFWWTRNMDQEAISNFMKSGLLNHESWIRLKHENPQLTIRGSN